MPDEEVCEYWKERLFNEPELRKIFTKEQLFDVLADDL